MQKILVLGGSGFVGRHVCEKLIRAGFAVTVPTRRRGHAAGLQHLPGLTVLELDVHQPSQLAAAVSGHDAVINLIAILHGDQAAFDRVHVELPRQLSAACRQSGVSRVVHVSALGVDASQPASAPSMYLRSKAAGEVVLSEFAKTAGVGLSVIRPSVIFGREDKFLNTFAGLQKMFPVVPLAGAMARFQPVWVEDVASAVVDRVKTLRPAEMHTMEACGPEIFTLQQLVQIAGQLAGVKGGAGRPVFGIPQWAAYAQAWSMEKLPGPTVMSRDNLDSMRIDNVATGQLPGLESIGIKPAALRPVASRYLA